MKIFPLLFISTISFAQVQTPADSLKTPAAVTYKVITTGAILINFSSNSIAHGVYHGFQITNGVQIGSYFYVGLGIGPNFYPGQPYGVAYNYLPVFLNTRLSYTFGAITPYGSLSIGYGICLEATGYRNTYNDPSPYGGLFFSPSAGISVRIYKSLSYLLGFGLNSQVIGAYPGFPIDTFSIESGISF